MLSWYNIRCRSEARLDFDAMDEFMSFVINAILEHGSRAVRVFPPESGVLIAFAERIAGEVVRVSWICFIPLSLFNSPPRSGSM